MTIPRIPEPEPPKNPTRKDFLLAGILTAFLLTGLFVVTSRPLDNGRDVAALADLSPDDVPGCVDGAVQATLTPSASLDGNVHIRLSTKLSAQVKVSELFMRSPSIAGGYRGVVNPPEGTVISAGHPFDWDVFLQTPVTGTIIGIHKEPWGVDAVHVVWTAKDGTHCDRID